MPSYLELAAEPWWRDEYIPPNLKILCERLQAFYGVGWTHIGCKGDNNHLRGAHRSRAWIKKSIYCTDRLYTVSRTSGDRSGGDSNWLAGMDATIPNDKLIAACRRLDEAVRAGLLEKITEWYGNDDGDNRVDGYDNIANRVASSDASHLWHLHLTFDRGRANEDHTDVYEILTGDDMTPEQAKQLQVTSDRVGYALAKGKTPAPVNSTPNPDDTEPLWIVERINAIEKAQAAQDAKLDLILAKLAGGPGGLVPHTHEGGETGPAVPTE
jgi:hypothetical protein